MKISQLPVLLLFMAVLFVSCEKETKESSEKDIISFVIEGIETKVESDRIIINFPSSVDEFLYAPTITISNNAKVFPESGLRVDFSQLAEYRVVAEDGSSKIYSIVTNRKEGISSVGIECTTKYNTKIFFKGNVNETEKTITIDMPYNELGNNSRFSISFSGNLYSTSLPPNNEAIDGPDKTILYDEVLLFDADLNKLETYKLIVRNTEAELTSIELPLKSFSLYGPPAPVLAAHAYDQYREGLDDWDFVYFIFEGQDYSNVKPILTYSKNATIKPSENDNINFNNIVTFEITSESGYKVSRKVKVVTKKIMITNDNGPTTLTSMEGDLLPIVYDAISLIKKAWLINEETNIEYECIASASSPYYENGADPSTQKGYYVNINAPVGMPDGIYKLKTELENGNVLITDARCKKGNSW